MIAFFAIATFVLSGHVLDKTTGQALPDVVVTAGRRHVKTDRAGAYALRGLTRGKITVVLESDDVPPQSFDLDVSKAIVHRDFQACSTTLDYSCTPQIAPPLPGS